MLASTLHHVVKIEICTQQNRFRVWWLQPRTYPQNIRQLGLPSPIGLHDHHSCWYCWLQSIHTRVYLKICYQNHITIIFPSTFSLPFGGTGENTRSLISHFTNISDTSVADDDQKPTFKTPRPSSHAEKRAAKPTASRSSQAPVRSRESFHFKVLEKVLRRLLTIIPFNPRNPKSNENNENLLKIGLKHWNMDNSYIQLPHLATPTLNHTVILRHTHPYARVDHDAAEDDFFRRPSYKSNLAMSIAAIGHGLIPMLPHYHLYYSVYIYILKCIIHIIYYRYIIIYIYIYYIIHYIYNMYIYIYNMYIYIYILI